MVSDGGSPDISSEEKSCSVCNSFKGVGPTGPTRAEYGKQADQLPDHEKVIGRRSFKNHGIMWSDLVDSAATCHCCSVLHQGIEGSLHQHAIAPNQIRKLDLDFLYQAFVDDIGDCDRDITCELANGDQFVIQFFTLLDEDCPCPDAWEDMPTSTRTTEGTDSEEALLKAQEWLDDCMSDSHEHCPVPQTRVLPTRVVDVGRRDGIIRLLPTEGRKDRYIALSHCWGKQQIITTTKATLEDRKKEIDAHDLSRTFMDAILMTRRLEFDYIWIDSLCIIQDDTLDWQRESVKMASIYKEAHLTLAATRSSSGAGGLFTATPDFEVSGITPEGEEYCLFFREKIGHDTTSLGPTYFPLFDRAWVCQERLLSPRVLHFGHHELFFECSELETCECGSIGFDGTNEEIPLPSVKLMYPSSIQPALAGKADFWDEDGRYYLARVWRSIVDLYTGLDLTLMSDRLPALSGVARDVSSKKNSAYLGGLWEASLLDDLLWVTYNCKQPRPPQWRAPTWSWASIESQIRYSDTFVYWDVDDWQEEPPKQEIFVEILGCETTIAGLDEFGQVEDGILTLIGPTVTGVLQRDENQKAFLRFADEHAIPFWPDYNLFLEGSDRMLHGSEILCLRIMQATDIRRDVSLVLRSSSKKPNTFERIGILHVEADRNPPITAEDLFCNHEVRTVTIV